MMRFKEWFNLTEIATDTWGTEPMYHPDVIAAYYNGPLPGNIDNSNRPPTKSDKIIYVRKKKRHSNHRGVFKNR